MLVCQLRCPGSISPPSVVSTLLSAPAAVPCHIGEARRTRLTSASKPAVRRNRSLTRLPVAASDNSILSQILSELGKTRADQERIRADLGRIRADLGLLLERQARPQIAKLFGETYSLQLTALSLQDLLYLLPANAIYQQPGFLDQREFVAAGRKVSSNLVAAGVPAQLLRTIHDNLKVP